jgi:hypothetical protein
MRKINIFCISGLQAGTVGPNGPSTRHNLLKGYRVVPGLRLRPDGSAWPVSFLCRVGPPLRRHELDRARASPARHGPLARYNPTTSESP